MKLSVISFTENGKQLSERIAKLLEKETEVELYTLCGRSKRACHIGMPRGYTKCRTERESDTSSDLKFVKTSVGDWAKEQMQEKNALLFIGACGIAVRAVAPHLTDKLHDAPVLVMDEKGKYVIPILSGHMGGANDLANHIAEKTGAEPVITTATDTNQKFAVDLFAKRNHLSIANKDGIAKVSAKVLAGKEITMSIETGHEIIGKTEGIQFVPYPPAGFVDVAVTSGNDVPDAALLLRPQEYVIGIGCKKGKSEIEIDHFISKIINETGISIRQVFALSSVSQKREEPGIVAWCRKEGIPFLTYTAEELQGVDGDFSESPFVRECIGVGNVCERAAVKACGEGGKLIVPKTAESGITIAVAKRKWKVCLDDK